MITITINPDANFINADDLERVLQSVGSRITNGVFTGGDNTVYVNGSVAGNCHIDNDNDRIEELEEIRSEYIFNESVTEDGHPSWGELAEAQAEAESRWNKTTDGQELKALLAKEGKE